MDWEKFLKRYVWDDEKTPYFVSVPNLTRRQADYEVHVYAIFIGVLFAVVAATGGKDGSVGVSLYAMTVVCATVIFAFLKHYHAALYLGAVPVATLAYFFLYGLRPNLETIDRVFIIGFIVIWLRYSFRIVAIGRAYPDLPESTKNE